MPVARIRKLLSSKFSLMIIMVFISCIPIFVHNLTHNSKYTNFNETNHKTNKISTYNEDDEEKEVPTDFRVVYAKVWVYSVSFVICCFLLQYFCWRHTLYYINNLYNRLFRRNQDNEPAVHYRDNRVTGIFWIGRDSSI